VPPSPVAVRAELTGGLLRVLAAVATIIQIVVQGGDLRPAPRSAALVVHGVFAIAALIAAVWILLFREHPDRAHEIGDVSFAFTMAFVVGYQIAFHGYPGTATLLVVIAAFEGPIRYGLTGAVVSAVPLTIVTLGWPQTSANGTVPPPLLVATSIVVVTALTALVTRYLRWSAAESRAASERFTRAFAEVPVGMAVTDGSGTILQANAALGRLVGVEPETLCGWPLSNLAAMTDRSRVQDALARATRGERATTEARLAPRDLATWVEVSVGPLLTRPGAIELIVNVQDVTARREEAFALAHRANHDLLTGLPNRFLLAERLAVALAMSERSRSVVAVLFMDLDRFKDVNDRLGHGVGDLVLRSVAAQLQASLRPGDMIARFGGDEFVVLCENLESPAAAAMVALRLLGVLAEPIVAGGCKFEVGGSIGVAVGAGGGMDPEELITAADSAMYRAKRNGDRGYELVDLGRASRPTTLASTTSGPIPALRSKRFGSGRSPS
jgi:diguanylate cyclase (GGDEF)-like protein/PAS domain S-box-containing protein